MSGGALPAVSCPRPASSGASAVDEAAAATVGAPCVEAASVVALAAASWMVVQWGAGGGEAMMACSCGAQVGVRLVWGGLRVCVRGCGW